MKNWTDHIRTLAKFEDNIGKQVAFETSASMLDDLHKENDELKQKLEAAERERDEAHEDACFYKSCALSGEVPIEGSQPSAKNEKVPND